MPDSDLQKEMQGKLTSAIDQATGSLRKEFERRLRELRKELEGQVSAVLAAQVAAPTTSTEPEEDTARILVDAAEAIDRTRSQTQVLAALLEGADTLASRAAVLLTRPDGIQGWGAVGFDEAGPKIEEVHLPYTEGSPWGEMANARGMVTLSRKDTAPLCKALGIDRPHEAVLIPIALADRTAATLYADRFGSDDRFDTYGLQILATIAGLTLETLPLRRRSATPSLRLAEEATGEAGLPPWDPQGIAADEEPSPATIAETEETEASEETEESASEAPIATEAVGFTVEEDPVATEPVATEPVATEPVATEPVASKDEKTPDAPYVKREAAEAAADAADRETAAEAEATPDPPAEPEAAPTDESAAATPKRPRRPRVGGSQVAPPPEVQGPGSAFSDLQADGADQALHEDARRLARLLVSEIKLYNEEKLAEGLSNKNILASLGDEIEQSRQAYDQRVDAAVRDASDYFQEELIRILARGDQAALGGS